MLDTYDSVYLWIGNESRIDEVEASTGAAIVSVIETNESIEF